LGEFDRIEIDTGTPWLRRTSLLSLTSASETLPMIFETYDRFV
jgi:hypothetical protein